MGELVAVCEPLIVRTKSAVYLVEPPNRFVVGDDQYKITKIESFCEEGSPNDRSFPVGKIIKGKEIRLEKNGYLEIVDVGFKSDIVLDVCSNNLDFCS